MAMALGKQRNTIGDINMTPLIDVLLVLLIIFMVIAPTRTVGLEAAVPQPAHDRPESLGPDRSVVVQIDKNLALTINSEPVDLERLGNRLVEIFKARAERVVFVKADRDVEFQHVARTIDIAKDAGIQTVGLLGDKL